MKEAKKFLKNMSLLERSKKVTPVGAQTFSKSYRYYSGGDYPYFAHHGSGSHVWDADNNEYIDFILGLGPVTIGYNDPEVNSAIVKQLEKGISFSQPTEIEVILAERLGEIIPSAEMVRFLKNGSDATTAAVRLARAATGRERIAACGYHGMHDWYVGSTKLRRGVPECVCKLTLPFIYNDIYSLEEIFSQYPNQVAAVILEPVQENGPEDNFLEKLKTLAHKHGALLIFDEIITGFRLALGGAQELYNITPDLTAIGKGMANGMPISAVVGRKDILKLIEEGVFISTTFGGETLSIAAALATIEILSRPESFKRIWSVSQKVLDGCRDAVIKLGMEGIAIPWGLAPHSGYTFEPVGNLTSIDLLSVFQQTMLKSGILTLGINNFCLKHSPEDVERYIEANFRALTILKKVIAQDSTDGIMKGPLINPIFKRN